MFCDCIRLSVCAVAFPSACAPPRSWLNHGRRPQRNTHFVHLRSAVPQTAPHHAPHAASNLCDAMDARVPVPWRHATKARGQLALNAAHERFPPRSMGGQLGQAPDADASLRLFWSPGLHACPVFTTVAVCLRWGHRGEACEVDLTPPCARATVRITLQTLADHNISIVPAATSLQPSVMCAKDTFFFNALFYTPE